MIGLRQDPFLKQQCQKNRQHNALSMSPSSLPNRDVRDCKIKHPKAEKNDSPIGNADDVLVGNDTNEITADDTENYSVVHEKNKRPDDIKQQEKPVVPKKDHGSANKAKPKTRIQVDHNTENSMTSLLRDIIIAFIPIFVLYKISTHPMISSIGYQDPNATRTFSHEELMGQLIYRIYLKEEQEKLKRKHIFFEAMLNKQEICHDYRPIDIPNEVKLYGKKQQTKKKSRGKKRKQRKQTKGSTVTKKKATIGKMNRPMAKRRSDSSPTSAPFGSYISSVFLGDANHGRVYKGSEATTIPNDSESNNEQGGKTTVIKKRPMKKKFGSRRPG